MLCVSEDKKKEQDSLDTTKYFKTTSQKKEKSIEK